MGASFGWPDPRLWTPAALAETVNFWSEWGERKARVAGARIHDCIVRSLITLKALTYAPTGGSDRRPDDIPAGEAGRRAQLGLPLLLDP